MRRILLVTLWIMSCAMVNGQTSGVNKDPDQKLIGELPYEMQGRTEDRVPLVDFNDCSKWEVSADQCEVKLVRSQEQRVFRKFSGKVIYMAKAKKAGFTIRLRQPIPLTQPWDCINFWNYGDHWIWESNAKSAMDLKVLISDAQGKIHELAMVQQGYGKMVHKYWFLNHHKLKKELLGPASFVGFKFESRQAEMGKTHTLFLESVYVYKEELTDLSFQPLPEKMPFPLRDQTILPIQKLADYTNDIQQKGKSYLFRYKGEDGKIQYEFRPEGFLDRLTVQYNGLKKVELFKGAELVIETDHEVEWDIDEEYIANDTLYVNYKVKAPGIQQEFMTWYTIQQKTLICGIDEIGNTGVVSDIKLGVHEVGKDARLVLVPMLNFNNNDRPAILYDNDLFHFTMFDWYYSNASKFFAGPKKVKNGQAAFNGGVSYIPLTNGKRNLLREKLFINVSPDVQEVLPTIDNPKSPMREAQADRLWVINGGTDLEVLGEFVTDLRAKGLEKVSIRYHEGFWRKGGESYTFKTDPQPIIGRSKN